MADEKEQDAQQKDKGEDKKEKKDAKKESKDQPKKGGLLLWILMGLGVVALSGGAGAGAAIFLGSADAADTGQQGQNAAADPAGEQTPKDFEYYEFEPVTVNLKVRRGNRYLKVKLFLAVQTSEQTEVFEHIEKKKKVLKNWLIAYLRDHTLEDVLGKKNQIRIQREICDSFNEKLWPDSKPKIDHVLFDEFTMT